MVDVSITTVPAKKLKSKVKELDRILCSYFMKARKFNKASMLYGGELYQPDSLSSFRNTFQRILEEKNSQLNMKTSPMFERSSGSCPENVYSLLPAAKK